MRRGELVELTVALLALGPAGAGRGVSQIVKQSGAKAN
jgi:hypothetical protein